MLSKTLFVLTSFITISIVQAGDLQAPRAGHLYAVNNCPDYFETCKPHVEWIVDDEVKVFSGMSRSEEIGILKKGETFYVDEAKLFLYPLVANVVYPHKEDLGDFKMGERFYILHGLPEAHTAVWIQGRIIGAGVNRRLQQCPTPSEDCWYETAKLEQDKIKYKKHWLRIRNQTGLAGWVSYDSGTMFPAYTKQR